MAGRFVCALRGWLKQAAKNLAKPQKKLRKAMGSTKKSKDHASLKQDKKGQWLVRCASVPTARAGAARPGTLIHGRSTPSRGRVFGQLRYPSLVREASVPRRAVPPRRG